MTEKEQKNRSRLVDLDCLRGIAAFSVVLFHYTYGIDHNDKIAGLQYGKMGVDLFFVISGFVIFMTIEKQKNKTDFPISRFIRLYPVYWIGVILTTLFSIIFLNNQISFFQFMANLSMLQYWLGVSDIDGAYWTLAVELSFYGFIYLLFLTDKLKYILSIGVVLLAAELFFYVFEYKNLIFTIFSFLKHWHLFFGGIVFYLTFQGKLSFQRLMPLAALIMLVGVLSKKDLVESVIEIGIFSVFLIYVWRKKLIHSKLIPVLMFFGNISYPLYVIHEVIGIGTIDLLDEKLGYFVSRFLTIIVMIAVSFLIYKYVEPFIKKGLYYKLNQLKSKKVKA